MTLRRSDALLVTLVGALAVAWLWLSATHTFVSAGDEAIYVLGGKLLSEGHLPYRDFFLAHPPLRVLLSGALFALGLPAVATKWLAVLATAANLALVAVAARRVGGALAGAAAAALWFGATLPLEVGAHFLGPNVATTCMLASCVAALHGRFGLSGAALGLGALQALYALLPGPVLLYAAWRSRRVRAFVVGGLVWPAGLTAMTGIAGEAVWSQTVAYHLRKVSSADKPWPVHRIVTFLTSDWLPVALGAAAWLAATGARRPRAPSQVTARAPLDGSLLVAAAAWQSLAVVCAYRSVQAYYFVLPLALLCIAGGVGAVALARRLGTSPARARVAWLTLALAWVLGAVPHLGGALQRRAFQPVIDAELTQLARLVTDKRPRSGLLWGDSSVAPLLSLRTGLPLAARQIDTNDKRFRAGLLSVDDVRTRILEAARPGVLMIAHHGVYRVPEIRAHVERRYRAQFVYDGRALPYQVVYLRHQDEARDPPPGAAAQPPR